MNDREFQRIVGGVLGHEPTVPPEEYLGLLLPDIDPKLVGDLLESVGYAVRSTPPKVPIETVAQFVLAIGMAIGLQVGKAQADG